MIQYVTSVYWKTRPAHVDITSSNRRYTLVEKKTKELSLVAHHRPLPEELGRRSRAVERAKRRWTVRSAQDEATRTHGSALAAGAAAVELELAEAAGVVAADGTHTGTAGAAALVRLAFLLENHAPPLGSGVLEPDLREKQITGWLFEVRFCLPCSNWFGVTIPSLV